MAKKLESSELHDLALELAKNQYFIERLDDYEKSAVKKFIANEIWLYSWKVRIGLKNIPPEEIDKIRSYKKARGVLAMYDLKKVFGEGLDAPEGNYEDNIDSNPVLGKLIALDAPETTGVQGVITWLTTKFGLDEETANKRGRAVYNHFKGATGLTKDKSMKESVIHLEKLSELIAVHPQFKKLLPVVKKYLKTANMPPQHRKK